MLAATGQQNGGAFGVDVDDRVRGEMQHTVARQVGCFERCFGGLRSRQKRATTAQSLDDLEPFRASLRQSTER